VSFSAGKRFANIRRAAADVPQGRAQGDQERRDLELDRVDAGRGVVARLEIVRVLFGLELLDDPRIGDLATLDGRFRVLLCGSPTRGTTPAAADDGNKRRKRVKTTEEPADIEGAAAIRSNQLPSPQK
jgi:hypothetical protein